ncbi:hypothetical protein DFH29DRAFT_1040613 [Suillus ampliporus]|nr:hypothetical protein DFH29DRAFT_1040613 [Suillus ampliporus]
MVKRRKLHSTFGSVQETGVFDLGTSRTSRANLSKICQDRLTFEQENQALHQGLLAEAVIYARPFKHPDIAFDGGDVSDGLMHDNEAIETPSSNKEDEGNDIDMPMVGHDGHAVAAARTHVIACIQGKRHHQRAPRTRLHRNHQMYAAWHSQMPSLIDAYLRWKHDDPNEVGADQPQVSALTFHVSTIDITFHTNVKVVSQGHEELANVSFLKLGLLGCSPLQPTITVSLHCLKLYHQIRRRKPLFSIQAMVKVLCALHNQTYFQSFRDQFAIAFDVYLCILHGIKAFVDEALQRDVANWHMLHACPPCNFKQPNELLLYPARLDSIDGNNSLKCVNGSGHADERVFNSSYLIPPVDVEVFKDDV